jgi:5-methylcytosine-specific restriction endonuclease McrA
VLKCDNFRCVWCGETKNLEVDHVYPFAYFPELRFEVTNGRTLCQRHHTETITYGTGSKKFYDRLINSHAEWQKSHSK